MNVFDVMIKNNNIALTVYFRQYNYMQAFSTTIRDLPTCLEDLIEEEGFAQEELQSLVVPKQEVQDDFAIPKTTRSKPKVLYRQPKIKLTFIEKQKHSKQQLRRSLVQKQERSLAGRSIDLGKRESHKSLQNDLLADCLTKIKRSLVGENISIPIFGLADSKAIKSHILSSGASLLYEQAKQTNTHGFLRGLVDKGATMLNNTFNQLLKVKMKESYIMPKKSWQSNGIKNVEFQGGYQGANLQFASYVGQNQYEIYLKNDTNTHGHQSWFLFNIKSNLVESQTITLHLCNLKRNLPMFSEGGRIYSRKLNELNEPISEWQPNGDNIQFKCNNNCKFTNARVYKLSFSLVLQAQQSIEIGLLPAYTYSDLMSEINLISQSSNLVVEVLTYSLVGLAIPLLTFTRGEQTNKQVILVSCRVHPGETNSSYMCRGLFNWLASDQPHVKQYLQKHIVKVVPMLNPDGVVLGNFRTNFMGADLNRSFDTDDQITNPQVIALKELGLRLKDQHGERFNLFLDLHGHSSQKNIFSYGPDFETTQTNFYKIRIFPKLLNLRSKMFKYHNCTFKLQDYKRSTARGFFLNTVNILAYTIEAGYSFYQDQGKNVLMGPHQWTTFGRTLAESLAILSKFNRLSNIKNRSDIKRMLGEVDKEQLQMIKKFKKEFKQEKEDPNRSVQKRKDKNGEDSDGEGDCEDYNRAEREEVIRRVAESVAPNTILPRVLKPSIVYPTVTPKLFKYRDEFEETSLKILYTKRSYRHSGMRMPGNGYIHSLRGLQLLRPDAKHLYS